MKKFNAATEKKMTADEFVKIVRRAGYTNQDLVEILGKSPRTITNYRSGATPIPPSIAYCVRGLNG